MILLSKLIFIFSLSMVLAVFLLPPLMFALMYLLKSKKPARYSSDLPRVSLVVVARNAEDVVESMIKNALSLNYPADKLEIIIFSDGSTDKTEMKARALASRNIHVFSSLSHEGKNSGINQAVMKCSGELLAFTDIDVVLAPDSLLFLVRHFGDPAVGGVCGNKIVIKDNNRLEDAQSVYTKFASYLKSMESRTGRISSNDGTLYVIRKELFRELPPAVTDDLYVCLSIVEQNFRFLFEPEARAFMSAPSKNLEHELRRRRRIVSTSLRGIFLLRKLLNPFEYGAFSISLFINKVLRRFLPVFLILLFVSSILLAFHNPIITSMLVLQAIFYLVALFYGVFLQHMPFLRPARRIASLAFYFCIGNYGAFNGLIDFLSGKRITKW
jgi:cellulose synthase/poly-beta-1,6-N-acetylglucosamine synthase-like glycosyltransferase